MSVIAEFLAKPYDQATYNCSHFVAELWERITGQSIEGFADPRKGRVEVRRRMQPSNGQAVPALVIFKSKSGPNHAGVMYQPGYIIHNTQRGVFIEPVRRLNNLYELVYYTCPQ